MKKFFTIVIGIVMLTSLAPLSISAEEESLLEFRPSPELVVIKSIEDNVLFEVVDEFEGNVKDMSIATGGRYVSSANRPLFDGFYDGRKLGSVISENASISAFTDINGKAIAFEFDSNSPLALEQIAAQTSATSPFHFKRHQYSNGYYFITQTIFVPSSMYNTKVQYYTHCYDTINNILYRLPGEITEVNEYGEAYLYEIESFYAAGGIEEEIADTHMIKLKKYPIISVFYDNEKVLFDQLPVIEEGRTLVPLRAIFEKIGAEVSWDGETSTITAKKEDTEIKLILNSKTAYKNGEEITLDVPAKSINGRTMVPVRFIADCFSVDVTWKPEYQRVVLTSDK